MRSIIKIVLSYFMLMLLLLSFAYILDGGSEIEQGNAPVIYYHTDQPLTIDDVKQLRSDDSQAQIHIPFTACGTLKDQSFVNPDLGKTSECSILYISGDSSLMINSSSGQLFADDTDACILSSQAAWELFGEDHVSTGTVQYNELMYTVRGVFDYDESIVIVPAASLITSSSSGGDDDIGGDDGDMASAQSSVTAGGGTYTDDPQQYSFTRMIINPDQAAEREEMIQMFENRSLSSSDKADCITYTRLAQMMMLLLPVIILTVTMFRCIRFSIVNRYKPFWLAGGIAGAVFMWWLFFAMSGITISIPPDMIPNRWSDFEFWSNKITGLRTAIAHMLFMNKSEVELIYYRPLASITGMAVITVILFFINMRIHRKETWRDIPLALIATGVTELVTVIIIRSAGWQIDNIRVLLLIWPYFIISMVFKKVKYTSHEFNEQYGMKDTLP